MVATTMSDNGTHHVKGGSRAAKKAGNIVKGAVAVTLVLKELDIRVEKISLCDMDALNVELMHQLQNPAIRIKH